MLESAELYKKLKSYAVDELMTVDGINNPIEAEVLKKMRQIATWPMFKQLFKASELVIH